MHYCDPSEFVEKEDTAGRKYYCVRCDMITDYDCGHFCFGNKLYRYDPEEGKSYWCSKCRRNVSYDCGHDSYGIINNLRDTDPG